MMDAFGVIPEMMEKGYYQECGLLYNVRIQCIASLGGAISPLSSIITKNKKLLALQEFLDRTS